MEQRHSLAFAAMVLLAACGPSEPDALIPADLVIINAVIHTMDGAGNPETGGTVAEALCSIGGEITFVGSQASAEACIHDQVEVIDADGRLVLPGLIDSHMHIFGGSISEERVNLSLADTTDKLVAALEQIRDDNPGDGVIYSRGWQNHLFPADGPRSALLDEIFGDRPVIIGSVDGHSTWFSSAALAAGGASAATPDPEPGVSFFERDPETGALLGTAREGAGSFITAALIERNPEDYDAALRRWLPRAAASGLTGAFDAGMGAPTEEQAYETLARLQDSGELTLRVFTSASWRGAGDDPAARLADYRARYSGDYLRPRAIKLFADGVPEAHTAFLSDDYADDPGNRGLPILDDDELARLVDAAYAAGVDVHVHAIGGAAVTQVLDAFEATKDAPGATAARRTIAHMDFVEPADVPRFAELDTVAQTSIHWATRDPSFDSIAAYVGEDVMEAAYPVRSLIEAGAVQSFGTDWPAATYLSTFEPMTMIEVAVTRRLPGRTDLPARNPDEALSVAEAVFAMTRAPAYQLGASDELGSLEPGKAADFILLDQNIFEIAPATIHQTRSLLTVSGGRIVHDALDR